MQKLNNVEMKDPTSHAENEFMQDNISEYAIIFVGFLIWWYVAPTIIPFVTSSCSGMGKTSEKLTMS